MIRNYLICFLLWSSINVYSQSLYRGKGKVSFISEAPLEIIKAESNELVGIIDMSNMNFAFSIDMASFQGFNSPLQKEHFKEHYLDTKKYPKAIFLGTIILTENCDGGCDTKAICKGKFTIHGVTKIVAIPVHLTVKDGALNISGEFLVRLSDYSIKIPRIVQAKIASEIKVTVQNVMQIDK
ncbi:YceI family protein [Pontimicrobium sp. IMCC45349]|uniref:YceI family protein n=1 Tax=Pontimicrobium sp. IMCC45349 TaxID=3391574 RepID=UPI0039A05DEF